MLKDYTRRELPSSRVRKIQSYYEDLLLSGRSKRTSMFPSYIERLSEDGHFAEFGVVPAEEMREYTIP